MPYRIRHPKKEETPSPIVASALSWRDTLTSKPKWIRGGCVALLFVVMVVGYLGYIGRKTEEQAWTLEAQAAHYFYDPPPLPKPKEPGKPAPTPTEITDKTERLKESARLYEKVLQKYAGSKVAPLALYMSGQVYYALADYEKAEAQYRAFLKKYPNEKAWAAALHVKLGLLKQIKGDHAAALSELQSAYAMKDAGLEDYAGFELAQWMEQMDKTKDAIGVYKKVSEGFADSPWGKEAKARLDVLVPPTPTPVPTPVATPISTPSAPGPGIPATPSSVPATKIAP